MKNSVKFDKEMDYLDYHLNLKNIKGKEGCLDTDNIRALSSAMKVYIKESETRERDLRERIHHLERSKKGNEEKLREFSAKTEGEKLHEEKRIQTIFLQTEEKISELDKVIKGKEGSLTSLKHKHEKLLAKFTQLNQDMITQTNNTKINEMHAKEEIENIRKERDLLKLEVRHLEEEISNYPATIAALKTEELNLNTKLSEKNEIIMIMKEKINETVKQTNQIQNNFTKAARDYAECRAKLNQSENGNISLQTKLHHLKENFTLQSQKLKNMKDENIELEDEMKKIRIENNTQNQLVVDLNKKNEHLDETVCRSQQKENDLSMKLNSCIDQIQVMDYKLEDAEKTLLHERNLKSEIEIELKNVQGKINYFKNETHELSEQLSLSQNRCEKYKEEKGEMAANIKNISDKSKESVLAMEDHLSKEQHKNIQLENDINEKTKILQELQKEINENIKTVISVEKVNDVFSAKLENMSKKCHDLQKYKRRHSELEKQLIKMKEEVNENKKLFQSSVEKEKEKYNILENKINFLEKSADVQNKVNENLRSEQKKDFERITMFESENKELNTIIYNLKMNRKIILEEKKQLELNIQNSIVVHKDLSAKYDKVIFVNSDQEKHIEYCKSALSELTERIKSDAERTDLILDENKSLTNQLKETKVNIHENEANLMLKDESIKLLQEQIKQLRINLSQSEKECHCFKEELIDLRQVSDKLQPLFAKTLKKMEELKRENNNYSKETEKLQTENSNFEQEVTQMREELFELNKKETLYKEGIKTLEKTIMTQEEEHEKMKISKIRTEQAFKSFSEEFNIKLIEFEKSQNNCEKLFKESNSLYEQITKMKEKLSANKLLLEEKSGKIETLSTENETMEKKTRESNKKLNECLQMLDESSNKNNKLTLQMSTFREQYEKCKAEEHIISTTLKQLQDTNSEIEMKNNKLNITVAAHKQKVNDQQRIIDEYEFKENLKLDCKQSVEHDMKTIKSSNADLQFQIGQLKEEAIRLKLSNEKFREDFSAKKLELENILSENEKLKRENLNLHNPCKNKIISLESKIDGLRERDAQFKKKFNQLKHEYEVMSQVNYELQCNFKFLDQEYVKLNDESTANKLAEEQHVKKRENDISTISELKAEHAKLVALLKRIQKNHDCLKVLLKTVEKDKLRLKLENEQLQINTNMLKANLNESTTEKMKAFSHNQQLKSNLNFLKYMEAARQSEYKLLKEKLHKSEMQLKVFLSESLPKPTQAEKQGDLHGTCQYHLLEKLISGKSKPEVKKKDNLIAKLISEFEEISKWNNFYDNNNNNNNCHKRNNYDESLENKFPDKFKLKRNQLFSNNYNFDSMTENFEQSKFLQMNMLSDILKLL